MLIIFNLLSLNIFFFAIISFISSTILSISVFASYSIYITSLHLLLNISILYSLSISLYMEILEPFIIIVTLCHLVRYYFNYQ